MKCADCGRDWGVYAPPCPAAPAGMLGHYCWSDGRGTYRTLEPSSDEAHAVIGGSVATSRRAAHDMLEGRQ